MNLKEKVNIIEKFILFVEEYLEIEELPVIRFVNDRQWATKFHSFGRYRNANKDIMVYLKERNLADILRTLGHELVHHKQNELGMLDATSGKTGSEIENQANATAGIMMRDFGKKHEQIYESQTIKLGNLLKEIKRK
jgi:Zn-dependent peptidase ImmA (M78 family)